MPAAGARTSATRGSGSTRGARRGAVERSQPREDAEEKLDRDAGAAGIGRTAAVKRGRSRDDSPPPEQSAGRPEYCRAAVLRSSHTERDHKSAVRITGDARPIIGQHRRIRRLRQQPRRSLIHCDGFRRRPYTRHQRSRFRSAIHRNQRLRLHRMRPPLTGTGWVIGVGRGNR